MDGAAHRPGIAAGRLGADQIAANFTDLHPALDAHEAAVAADRCYFCHDAPCITACPTGIDIPLFIRQIATGQPRAAALTIFDSNILGGMCARVCPTETLCEEACVRMTAEHKPVEIGRLQRFATDAQMATGRHPFTRAAPTGRRVAVVGAGPAGLACAHRLAMHGHDVVVMDARPRAGGLNEYGIAAYKTPGDFAQAEIAWLMQIGGIALRTGTGLGGAVTLDRLAAEYDAVFLGLGLGAVNALACEGADLAGVEDAVAFIARLRQSSDLSALPVGRRVVVIGGGMTAVDAAVQSKLLGADEVTIVYRRAKSAMSASLYEQDLAASRGVRLIYNARPLRVIGQDRAEAVEFDYTADGPDGLESTGETFRLPADQVFRAIGQTLVTGPLAGLDLDGRKIAVDAHGHTSRARVWAGGDCAAGGADLTVTAVAQGRDAAESIHRALGG
ncbi:MAG: NAD(P)-dependent oxidoreductase [Thermohalobaculum sp.]|nr:NAD(P)-dependent oxidoreductase [Thermohalobaculum sp.]